MKRLSFIIGILLGCVLTGVAQVSVDLVLNQKQFLPNEAMPVAVKITNRSGRPLHLGAEANWLTFNIESLEGADVVKLGEVPVVGEFDLESSQMATKHVDLAPYFSLPKEGRYKILATLRIHDWSAEMVGTPTYFDVINGVAIWSQDFGIPASGTATNRVPELRNYSLLKVSYLSSEMRLYVQVRNPANAQVYKVAQVGTLVSFSAPEAQLDELSNLHVLFQSGASIFSYAVIDPNGNSFREELYDYVTTRPRLALNAQGEVMVQGGVRRLKTTEMPRVKMPNEVQLPAQVPDKQ